MNTVEVSLKFMAAKGKVEEKGKAQETTPAPKDIGKSFSGFTGFGQ